MTYKSKIKFYDHFIVIYSVLYAMYNLLLSYVFEILMIFWLIKLIM